MGPNCNSVSWPCLLELEGNNFVSLFNLMKKCLWGIILTIWENCAFSTFATSARHTKIRRKDSWVPLVKVNFSKGNFLRVQNQLRFISLQAQKVQSRYSSVRNWSHLATIWNMSFIWIMSFFTNMSHVYDLNQYIFMMSHQYYLNYVVLSFIWATWWQNS